MASTKRVTGDYNIYADEVRINGNLVVIGTQTSIETVDTSITDNILSLNVGEDGAGVTLGNAGIQIDRGSLPNAFWVFQEDTVSYWAGDVNGSLTAIKAASPVDNDDVVTKGYLLSVGGTSSGPNRAIQYASSSLLSGDAQFSYFANGNVVIGTTLLSNTAIYSSTGNNDIKLNAGGSGTVYVQDVMKLDYQAGSTPSNVPSTVQVLANTPGEGGSGLYIVNSNYSDELVSKRKATWLGLVFS